MKKNRILFFVAVVIFIGIYFSYKYMYHAHDTTVDQEFAFDGTAKELIQLVTSDPISVQNSYVQLNGIINQNSGSNFVLDQSIFCQAETIDAFKNAQNGTQITIKGRFIGYDDLLEEIKLDKCIIIK